MLEEVCEAQARGFRDRLPGYHYRFTVMRRRDTRCRNHGPDFGDVVASRWPLSRVTRTNLRGDGHRQPGEAKRSFRLTCVQIAASHVPAGRLRACVTHLRAGHQSDRPWLDAARTLQVHRIHKALHNNVVHRHVRVVVAGDFNARPQNRALDGMYRLKRGGGLDGAGDFFEGDQTDHRYFAPSGCGLHACRSGEFTCCGAGEPLDRKYDYAFFSAPGVSRLSGRPFELDGSDHALYRGSARFVSERASGPPRARCRTSPAAAPTTPGTLCSTDSISEHLGEPLVSSGSRHSESGRVVPPGERGSETPVLLGIHRLPELNAVALGVANFREAAIRVAHRIDVD